MTHESYPKELQEKIGISQNLLRLAIGIENADDLIDDLKQALIKAKK
ncbi:Cys/Met metabolism PLP-dependent enzyme domain protein [Campylobacter sp. FOBRC14]|nr:Cys/Met metabolism PLP-dependent enzyme domain protein [Campylobacter sp. FOBRC14]